MAGIVVFLMLNFVLFAPRYAFNNKTAAFFPINDFFPKGRFRIQPLLTRFNEDVFRLHWEYALVLLLLSLLQNVIPIEIAKLLLALFYGFTFLFMVYHHSIYGLYKSYPCLKSDCALIKQGFQIAYSGYKVTLAIGILLFIGLIAVLIWANFYLLTLLNTSNAVPTLCGIILGTGVVYYRYKKVNPLRFTDESQFEIHHFATIQWSTALWLSNRFFTRKTNEDLVQIPQLISDNCITIPKELELKSKPNICFIAIESYGAILYENEGYRNQYQEVLQQLENSLQQQDYKSATILSETTVTGGASWVSFSSFLKGLKIKNDFMYRHLLNHQKDVPTQSVLALLEAMGYNTYLVAGIGGFETLTIEWEKIMSFLGTQKAIAFNDLAYNGVAFNFGPSAPDQFLLNKSRALMETQSQNQPYAFFVETINSHYPFDSPTVVFPDWNQCQQAQREDYQPLTNLTENPTENYFKAMKYQLQVIADFIKNDTDSNTIYVLFGDHQPPFITHAKNSSQTPIHVISKNAEFIQPWLDLGFTHGWQAQFPSTIPFRHADFKRHFVDAFIKTYRT